MFRFAAILLVVVASFVSAAPASACDRPGLFPRARAVVRGEIRIVARVVAAPLRLAVAPARVAAGFVARHVTLARFFGVPVLVPRLAATK